ncbi:glycosyl hydrolase [Bacillus sp. FJAT-26390]|nr:glycosyl hydrolase [Bacillus sp. FJAT-26390]
MNDKNGVLRLVRSRKVFLTASLLILFIGAAVCMDELVGPSKEEGQTSELSAWLADWQWQTGLENLDAIKGSLTSLQMFAAYFDQTDSLYFTDSFHEALPEVLKLYEHSGLDHVYLTVVNDQFQPSGESVQKDPALITRLMGTVESRRKHADELIAAVEQYGFGGIELDYERVADEDWDNLLLFFSDLYPRLQEKGKSLRIVLETRAKIEELKLPEGPDYVMMAYNLYGSHSGPGPKADHAFIKELTSRMGSLPGQPYIAFSVGGFDWQEGGKAKALTEVQASILAKQTGSTIRRDEASGSVYFDYTAEDQVKHTVWYADEETLSQWIEVAGQAGYGKVAIWRLGEMQRSSLDLLKQHLK